jgi:hypothetical protein
MISILKLEILAPEYGALFSIHQTLRVADSGLKDNKKTSSTHETFSEQENVIHTHRK